MVSDFMRLNKATTEVASFVLNSTSVPHYLILGFEH